MRSRVLNGVVRTPFGLVQTRGTALVNGADDTGGDGDFWSTVVNIAYDIAGKWFGPDYDPNNGGELKRQLDSEHWTPFAQSLYVSWLKQNGGTTPGTPYDRRMNPNMTPNGNAAHGYDIWAADGYNPSDFNAVITTKFPGFSVLSSTALPTAGGGTSPGTGTTTWGPAEEQALATLAWQLIGGAGAAAQQQAQSLYVQLPTVMQAHVQQLIAVYQAHQQDGTGTDTVDVTPPKPNEAGFGSAVLILAALVVVPMLFGNTKKR